MSGGYRTGRAALCGVAVAALLAPMAHAQTLEEIVVTSDRQNSYGADLIQAGSFRGARQLDTPLTVSVIPQEVLQSQQAEGLFDALRNTAGVTSAQTSPVVYNNLSIRGIPVENRGNYRLNGSLRPRISAPTGRPTMPTRPTSSAMWSGASTTPGRQSSTTACRRKNAGDISPI